MTIEEARKFTAVQRYQMRQRGIDVPILPPHSTKGTKKSEESKRKCARWGEEHHAWKGDKATKNSGHHRAHRRFPDIGPCTKCGNPKSQRHHIDGNPLNNAAENIMIVCYRCHMEIDGRLEKLRSQAKKASHIRHYGIYQPEEHNKDG